MIFMNAPADPDMQERLMDAINRMRENLSLASWSIDFCAQCVACSRSNADLMDIMEDLLRLHASFKKILTDFNEVLTIYDEFKH